MTLLVASRSLPALALLAVLLATPAPAQDTDPADVASIDAIITAIYDVISGPAGETRDWDRFRSLLTPTCQFVPIQQNPDGTHQHRPMDAEGFIEGASRYFEANGFYERELARKTERYGNLAQAFSTYGSYHQAEETDPFARGINSFQLVYEQNRWWIANVVWQAEWPDLPIPDPYLPDTH